MLSIVLRTHIALIIIIILTGYTSSSVSAKLGRQYMYTPEIIINDKNTTNSQIDINALDIDIPIARGYDILSGDYKQYCLKQELSTIQPPVFDETYRFNATIHFAESSSELAEELDISTSASIGWGSGKASAKYSYYESQKFKQYSLYLVFKFNAEIGSIFIDPSNLRLDNASKELLLKNTPQSHADFRRICGNRYIDAANFGSNGYIVFEVNTDSLEEKKVIKASLKADGVGAGVQYDFNAKLTQTLNKIASYRLITIRAFIEGPQPTTPIDGDISRIIKFVETYSQYVKGKTSALISLRLQDYEHLYPPGVDIEKVTRYIEKLKLLHPKLHKIRGQISAFNDVLTNPELYIISDTDLVNIGMLLQNLDQQYEALIKIRDYCYEGNKSGCVSYHKPIRNYPIPKRRPQIFPDGACSKNDFQFYSMSGGCRHMATGVTWNSSIQTKNTFAVADNYCRDTKLNGHDGWRLPNSTNIVSIAGSTKAGTYLDIDYRNTRYWTLGKTVANLENGRIITPYSVNLPFGILCVRDGP
ncbi:MAG: DUF1566 domain-containing protein [Candidatus Thiodiazotropha endolucinida]|nr:DUF1566 domain-containing protein [Candidatus Thiodiazotropha taylori]MCW4318764.1 DUF1566 domain-containing protein [Candidatus Thiodiazotropha taylori]